MAAIGEQRLTISSKTSVPCVLSTEEVASLLTAARYRPDKLTIQLSSDTGLS